MIRYLVGDVFDRMSELEDGSVDLILTSPPFLALRSYLPADHPLKAKEIGSESTPAEFIDTLLRLTAEWRRLLAPHGSLVVELGDTYAGGGGGPWQQVTGELSEYVAGPPNARGGPGWPLAKSLTLTPESYRFALAYGFNPHTGTESPAGTWRIRNVVRWVRPNPPVGALGDKFRPATSELVVACTSDRRWFDLDAVRTPHQTDPHLYSGNGYTKGHPEGLIGNESMPGNPIGAPPLDWWKLSPGGYSGAHYAVWPPDLCVKPIKSMCPREVCRECGQPRRRVLKQENASEERLALADHMKERREALGISRADFVPYFPHYKNGESIMAQVSNWELAKSVPSALDWPILVELLDLSEEFAYLIEGNRQWTESLIEYEDVSDHPSGRTQKASGRVYQRLNSRKNRIHPEDQWTDCGHGNYRPGLVLDPFAGTGTTLMVAHGHGRDAIGIDLDERNAELARERVGPMFLEVG